MEFGYALEAMKKGHKVAREIWNGKQFVIHRYPDGSSIEGFPPLSTGNFYLKNAQNCIEPGWTPSAADMMAKDWQIVD